MYECRVCRTIFRSLANFILHKRNYCRIKYKNLTSNCREDSHVEKVPPPEPPEDKRLDRDTAKGLAPVIEKLKEKQEIKQLTQELLTADLSGEKKTEAAAISVSESDMLLEEIATNNAAVFQTVLQSMPRHGVAKTECMKKEVMELHGILESDEAVLGADGKICNFQTNKLNAKSVLPKTELSCSECNIKFSTRKTLGFHLKNKHNNSRLVYVCPDCKETYTNAWSVYRHLFKVHRKTAAQVKRLREQVYNSVIRKDQETHKKAEKKDSSNLDKADEENQWLNNIEGDNDFQMCGGCGKRFERKAALQSHASMCIKRIAVCNTIKENNAKKREEETKAKLNKPDKTSSPEQVDAQMMKGASKRKPYLLRTYKQTPPSSAAAEGHTSSDAVVSKTKTACDTTHVNGKDSSDNERSVDNCDGHKCKICDVNDNNDVQTECDCPKAGHVGGNATTTLVVDKKNAVVVNSKDGECFCSSPGGIGIRTDKMLSILGMQLMNSIDPDDRIELIKEEVTSPSVQSDQSDTKCQNFDLFCQKVAEHLRKIKKPDDNNAEESEKSSVSPAEQTSAKLVDTRPRDGSKNNQSPGKISIRSLEELRGFPKEPIDAEMPVLEPSVSPRTPKRSPRSPRVVKRKRTSSLDSEKTAKTFKQSNFDVLLDKQDLNFMARASPHMDRGTLTCKSCRTQHPSLSKLLWHMSAHFSWFRFQCSRCSFVSFGKAECANHAKANHEIKNSEIPSVVLPIPNWKTLLMSNEFKELSNENELGGKLTDEVNSYCQNEPALAENNENDPSSNLINTLFVDSESDAIDLNELAEVRSFPMPTIDEVTSIKHDVIDVTEDDDERFQLEVPQEIYSLDVFEVINEEGDDEEDVEEELRALIKEECCDEEGETRRRTPGVEPADSVEARDCDKSPPSSECIVNIRPTRNRMRSIKTLQNDFFYDLGKVTKQQPDPTAAAPTTTTANKTNGPHKLKKNNGSSNVRKDKEVMVASKK